MKLDLWELLEGEKELIEFQGEIPWEGFNSNDKTEPIQYKGQVYNVGGDKVININIHYTFKEKCSRCLKSTVNKIDTTLSGKLMEGKEDFEEIESFKEIENEDINNEDNSYENILYYENNNLNLHDYIIEQVVLSLPMKTICKDDCKGLCPKCGINLNNSKCDCVYEDIDPRLEKLKDFFPKK